MNDTIDLNNNNADMEEDSSDAIHNDEDDEEDDDFDDQDEQEDEQEEVEDEDEEEDDFVDNDYEDVAWERQLADFETSCVRIEANDPDLIEYCPSSTSINDERATRFGAALLGNTHLKELSIEMAWTMSARGADALVQGILGSCIQDLSIFRTEGMPLELSHLYVAPMRMVETLTLIFPQDDGNLLRLGQALAGNQSLKSLSLHVDHMSPRGAQFLSHGLVSSHLTKLILIGHSIDPEATRVPMQTLYKHGIQNSSTIRTLQLLEILGDMEALSMVLPKLESFVISEIDRKLTFHDVEVLRKGLSLAHQLFDLRICSAKLTDDHLRILSPILGNHPTLESLELRNNMFGDEGVASFVEHWQQDSLIWELDLGANKIGPAGALQLLQTVGTPTQHPNMRILNLEENWDIGYNGLKLLGEALSSQKNIKELNLSAVATWIDYHDITCDDAVAQESQRAQACRALLKGIRDNVDLHYLNLDDNDLPLAVTEEIDLYVKANKSGRVFLRQQNRQPPAFWCHFLARRNASLVFLCLRELPIVFMSQCR